MHFGYSLYADHKEEHVIVKKENSNRTYYDEVKYARNVKEKSSGKG